MSFEIIVRFPSKEIASAWIGQMSDGFGENFCDFTPRQPGTNEKVTGSAPEGTPVYFVQKIFNY